MDTAGIQDLNLPVRGTGDPNLVAINDESTIPKADDDAENNAINDPEVKGKDESEDLIEGQVDIGDPKKKKDNEPPESKGSWLLPRLWNTYDRNMLLSLALQYFNQNMTISMAFLAIYDLFKNKYGMQPE